MNLAKIFLDLFLLEGEEMIFGMVLMMISYNEEKILNIKNEMELNAYFRKNIFEEINDVYGKFVF